MATVSAIERFNSYSL